MSCAGRRWPSSIRTFALTRRASPAAEGPRWTLAPATMRTLAVAEARAGNIEPDEAIDAAAISASIMCPGVTAVRSMVNGAFTTVPLGDWSKAVARVGPLC